MDANTNGNHPHQGLLDWLTERHIEFEVHEHAPSFTATGTARAEGVEPKAFAKVVGVLTDDRRSVLLVLDAPDHVDLKKAQGSLEATNVRLLSEPELTAIAPGCEPGALPAVGELFGLTMVADFAVRDDPEISFNAGTHRHAVRVDRGAWERATRVRYADLAAQDDRPAWADS
jgi:Ala-tRNA(Pro) deacylase